MTTQIQYRRGTTAQNNSFTGALGEITVDTTLKTLRVHDGATQGGFATAGETTTQTLTNKTLSSPALSGTMTGTAVINLTGNITATNFLGTVATASQPSITSLGTLTGLTVSGNATVNGNLTVTGTTTYVNTTTLNVGDNIITLNADETGTPSQNGGIEIERVAVFGRCLREGGPPLRGGHRSARTRGDMY